MVAPVSRRQARYMYAILNSKKGGTSSRGDRIPKSVAAKYSKGNTKNLPESKGKERDGGLWGEHSKEHRSSHNKDRKNSKKKSKEKMSKALLDFLKRSPIDIGICIVANEEGEILMGKRTDDGMYTLPGGHIESGETNDKGTIREVKEETGITCKSLKEVTTFENASHHNLNIWIYECKDWKGTPKDTKELYDVKFIAMHDIPWKNLHPYTAENLNKYLQYKIKGNKLSKSLLDLIAYEDLQKNIIRQNGPSHVTYEVTHGDAMKLVGNGTFRFLKRCVQDMEDEAFKNIEFDNYIISIRKHVNDVYSGRIVDGHKQIHQFTHKSLPQVAAELMSVFEWYSPEDESVLDMLSEEDLTDDAIEGGINNLIDNYKKHNLGNIYVEMEHIREEIRNGTAVDLQQVEQRVMKLFDKLDKNILQIVDKHNDLASKVGSAVDELEGKLREMQAKLEEINSKPTKVDAISSKPESAPQVYNEYYSYLTRPKIEISPNGKITILFDGDWTGSDRENFLSDMKAKALKKSRG